MTPEEEAASLARALGGKRTARGWKVHCPAHDDEHPSLDIDTSTTGILLCCRAGCPNDRVVAALRDLGLWTAREPDRSASTRQGAMTARYEYRDENGTLLALKERYETPDEKWFRWRTPDGSPGLKGFKPSLYRLERLAGGQGLVEITEGEKCVHALESMGLTAVCAPGGAKNSAAGGWDERFSQALAARDVRLWPDNDPAGRQHMEAAARSLKAAGCRVRWVELPDLPPKGDVADLLAVGVPPEDLLGAAEAASVRHNDADPVSLCDLLDMTIPELRWVVPDLLPEGVTILAGKPKMGKSWMALDLAIVVAEGGLALGSIPVESGEVLYLALEDTLRRLKERSAHLLAGRPAPPGLEFQLRCPKLDAGGSETIEDWLKSHPGARLIIIDTFKHVRPKGGNGTLYEEDYEALMPLGALARTHRVSLLVVHHLRKAEAQDPLDALNGSIGMAAAVDGLLIVRRDRSEASATMHVINRESTDRELALRFDNEPCTWSIVGDAEEVRISKSRQEILGVLEDVPDGMTPQQVCKALDRPNNSTIRHLLRRLLDDGHVERDEDGRYRIAGHTVHAYTPPADSPSARQIPLGERVRGRVRKGETVHADQPPPYPKSCLNCGPSTNWVLSHGAWYCRTCSGLDGGPSAVIFRTAQYEVDTVRAAEPEVDPAHTTESTGVIFR